MTAPPAAAAPEPEEVEGAVLDLADQELEALKRKVATMRELGVRRWGEIYLAPPPPPPPPKEKRREPLTPEQLAEQRLKVMMRSAGVSPSSSFVRRFVALETGPSLEEELDQEEEQAS